MVFNDITYRINAESCYFSGGFRPDRRANKGPTHPWFATTWHGDQVVGQYNKNYFKEFARKWSLIHRRQKCCCSWPATWLPWRHVQISKNREARISLEAKPRTKLDVTWLANSYVSAVLKTLWKIPGQISTGKSLLIRQWHCTALS